VDSHTAGSPASRRSATSTENEDAIPYNRHIGLMKMSALVSPILGRLAAAEAMLTDKMNRGELKESEARLLKFAKYMIEAETPVVGDFQTGLINQKSIEQTGRRAGSFSHFARHCIQAVLC